MIQGKSYRQRYWNVTSFVDEFIGNTSYKLSIAFFDPSLLGFSTDNPATGVETLVAAFVQLFIYNDENAAGMAKSGFNAFDVVLVHQVRKQPNSDLREIRSRFWFGSGLVTLMRLVMDPLQLAHDLSVHCFNEMSHIGTFLPELYPIFKDNIPS